jgi:hypothetical protein
MKKTAREEEPNNIIIGSYMNQHDTVGAELFNGVKREDEYSSTFSYHKSTTTTTTIATT